MDKEAGMALTGRELKQAVSRAGYDSRLSRPTCYEQKLVEGRFELLEFNDGLSVHYSDLTELRAVTNSAELSPRVSFIVLLAGELRFAVDNQQHHMRSRGHASGASALIVKERAVLQRILRPGTHVTKVQVTVTPQWLEKYCNAMASRVWALALDREGDMPEWQPSAAMVTAAKAILAPSERPAYLQELFVQHHAFAIVSEGLAALDRLQQQRSEFSSRRSCQVAAVQDHLDKHLSQPLNLAAVGRLFGMSVSTLQRYFRQVTGMTVGEYVRSQRLDVARQQLLERGASIGEVAFAAGYTHTTNFITAYKKQFGCSPGDERHSALAREQ
jgi:AraC-like DNA-binding protein